MVASLAGPRRLHDSVREAIEAQIRSGALPPGSRLQSERDLAERFGVSRVTVRRALDALAREGFVRAAPGSGRYVEAAALTEPPNALLSFTELGAQRGLLATSRVLGARVRPATLEEADAARIAPGANLFELRRLRMLDGVAVALDHTRVPLAVAPDLPTIDFETTSLYAALAAAGASVVSADYSTEACAATAPQARRLGVDPGDPLLLARTTSFDAAGRVVELGETFYRGDRYRFHATLVREQRPGGGRTR
ncbi:MAG: GntR family transcriptional regulator [Gaiellales bacterium]